jgi:DNA-binding XRE family transcriptional regulator
MVSKLKVERFKLGLTQFDFWKRAEIPQWKISLIERGLRPSRQEALKIAGVLGQAVNELFPDNADIGGAHADPQ